MLKRKDSKVKQLRIGVAQVAQSGDIQANLKKARAYIDKAVAKGVELLCFPEVFACRV